MNLSEDEIRHLVADFEKMLRESRDIQLDFEVGTVGYGNSFTGNMEYQPTSGKRITITINGGPTHQIV